ncbi:UNVERIFIED_CONTAM: hypothetical protein FKN15_040648 [Acipenser sinensis]
MPWHSLCMFSSRISTPHLSLRSWISVCLGPARGSARNHRDGQRVNKRLATDRNNSITAQCKHHGYVMPRRQRREKENPAVASVEQTQLTPNKTNLHPERSARSLLNLIIHPSPLVQELYQIQLAQTALPFGTCEWVFYTGKHTKPFSRS